jgi:hypothetical protein
MEHNGTVYLPRYLRTKQYGLRIKFIQGQIVKKKITAALYDDGKVE